MADVHRERVSARHWMVVVGSGLLMSMNVLLFLAAGVMLPPLAGSLGVGLGQVMVFVSINMVAGAVTLTVAGPFLIRRFGTRHLAIVGGAFTGAALFSVCFVTDLVQLYLLAFASGLFGGVSMQMTGAVLVGAWFVRHRGLMQGVLMGIAGVGGIAAGGLSRQLSLASVPHISAKPGLAARPADDAIRSLEQAPSRVDGKPAM